MIEIVRRHIVPAAYAVLPREMESPEATAFVLAIAWQESRCRERVQIVITQDGRRVPGPAKGLWQGEQTGGCVRTLGHRATRTHALNALEALGYSRSITPWGLYVAMEHNDVLACVLARLLLWTLPWPLPRRNQPHEGWRQYLEAWRPGDPHPETWNGAWSVGWETA